MSCTMAVTWLKMFHNWKIPIECKGGVYSFQLLYELRIDLTVTPWICNVARRQLCCSAEFEKDSNRCIKQNQVSARGSFWYHKSVFKTFDMKKWIDKMLVHVGVFSGVFRCAPSAVLTPRPPDFSSRFHCFPVRFFPVRILELYFLLITIFFRRIWALGVC